MAGYIGVNGKARDALALYAGVNGAAKRIIKAYVGDESGKARPWYGQSPITFIFRAPHDAEMVDYRDTECHALDGMTITDWFKSEEFFSQQSDFSGRIVTEGNTKDGTKFVIKLANPVGKSFYCTLDLKKPIHLRNGCICRFAGATVGIEVTYP